MANHSHPPKLPSEFQDLTDRPTVVQNSRWRGTPTGRIGRAGRLAICAPQPPHRETSPSGSSRQLSEDQLDPVRTLGPERIDRPRERVCHHGLAHQRRQSLGTFAEVDRPGRHHHPDRARRSDHAPAFNARSTAIKVFASAPRLTRIVTPSISTSIIPPAGSALHGGALRWRRTVDAGGATSTTAGTNCNLSASEGSAWDSRN
jgi:hypothetical protein